YRPLPPMPAPASQSAASDLSSFRSGSFSSASSRRRSREAERRQVTVVACGRDLVEADTYLELDAGDQAQVLSAFADACQRPLRELDGTVVECNAKGLLACFGYPVAYEDGAQRAATAGLRILDGMRDLQGELRRGHKLELKAWVGIHTGPAVVEARED